MIAVLDFGAQYNLLIARRVREIGFHSEVVPYDVTPESLRAQGASALILSGGPATVLDGSILPRRDVLEMGLPMLGICYGMQVICQMMGGRVETGTEQEYGKQVLRRLSDSVLLADTADPVQVWMSHGDLVTDLPPGARTVAATATCPHAAAEDPRARVFMTQFHPEVSHTPQGERMLRNFLERGCGLKPDWSLQDFIGRTVASIRQETEGARAVCAVSGGVDSTVAAVLAHQAMGDRLHPIFVDTGMLRKGEAEDVVHLFRDRLGFEIHAVDARERFLTALRGVAEPEGKRKIIGETFIRVFEEESKHLGPVEFLIQGTLYPDVIESKSPHGPSSTIKTHHNVGGLPERMDMKLIEPLRELFKDEVRNVGKMLGIDPFLLGRHPFPGPGLGVRVLGAVDEESLRKVREADHIFIEELRRSGEYDNIWQAFTVLMPVNTVGVKGDMRTYENPVALRAVTSVDGMTADWARIPNEVLERVANRIVNEVRGLNRVVYDITSKPPGTIEWE